MLDKRPKLPVQQLIVLCELLFLSCFGYEANRKLFIAICRFAEPGMSQRIVRIPRKLELNDPLTVVLTSILPYLVCFV